MSLRSDNDADHANAPSSMKSADKDKLETLNRRTESVMTAMKTVLSNQDRLEELIKTHLSVIMGPRCSHASSNSDEGRATTTDTAVPNDKRDISTKKKNRKKKRKKKAKGDSNKVANWAAGNFVKILVGLFSLALLVSVALGLGQGGVWGPSHSLLRKRTDQSPSSHIGTTDVESQDTTHSAKQLGDDADEEAIDPAIASKLKAFDSLLEHNVAQSNSFSISYFYPSWEHDLYCHNDPSQRPSNYVEIGHTLFETAEDCCKHWTTDQGYTTNEGYDTCLLNSARTSRPEGIETGIPTTSPLISGSESSPVTTDLSQAKDSHVPSSVPTPMGTSNSPTSTFHHQDPHHLDHPNHGDNDITHTNGPTTEASNEPTHSLTSSPNDDQDDKSSDYVPATNDLTIEQDEHGIDDTPVCSVADKNTCGCGNVQQKDYRGTMNTTADGVPCVAWGVHWGDDYLQEYPKFGLESNSNNSEGNNFCRNPYPEVLGRAWCYTSDRDWNYCDVPMCNPHQCMPPCGTPNFDSSGCPSFLQAENCCEGEEDTSSCKCDYLKEACRKSLEIGTEDFCDDAVAACYEGKYDPHYKCRMYEQICSETKIEYICSLAKSSCCGNGVSSWSEPQCTCDFFTYTTNVLEVEGTSISAIEKCLEATKQSISFPPLEKESLAQFYRNTGGEHWFNNDKWLDDEDHCNWFGVACNGDGLVTEINLRNNNVTGAEAISSLILPELTWLDLAENNLWGPVPRGVTPYLRKLRHIDISENQFSGHVDMTFSTSTVHANYSHNKFTSAGFNAFNAAYESMRVVDLSSNRIKQAASQIFFNIPPNLEELNLSNNNIRGALPVPFPSLDNVRRFAMANNNITGPLPDFSRSTPRVRELDLSNQKRTGNRGFTGTVSADISRLGDLLVLNLAVNNLKSIPSDLGNLAKLKSLNISSNFLDQTIPPELGKLGGVLDSLDLSNNRLKGLIPEDFVQFVDTYIHLRGNPDILHPAPLMLCFQKFDLGNDTEMCPPERNALKEFYESAKGQDWTNSTMWMDPYESFCKWHGVTCSKTNHTVEVNLTNNALSGTLSEHISDLTHLMILDLADNDLMGSIPKEIGRLSKLVRLRLPYNRFGGEMPSELKNLSELELAQFHANRISGTMPLLDWDNQEQSSYITDCGNPSDFETSLNCTECSMCCNAQGDCYPQQKTMVQEAGFENYVVFFLAFLAILIGVSGVLALAVLAYDKHQNRHVPRETIRSPELTSRDEKYALSTIGEDSTYKFFQGKSWFGWMISLATVGVQIWLLFIFVTAADIDLADETSALVYTWKCPRDRVECEFKGDLTLQGWVLFSILMVAYLMKDFVNGYRLVVLSAKERHVRDARVRYFVGGTVLTAVTLFTLGVSVIYNYATATSNPELVANSVIILFIADLDEQFYGILMAINPGWVKEMSCEVGGSDEEESQTIRDLRREMKELRESLRLLAQQVRGGNATQPQAIGSSSRHSNVSNRSSSSSGGGSDWSGSPPRFRNTRRPSPTTRPRRNAFSIPSEPRIHHPSSIGRDGSFRPTSTSASDTTARSPTIRPSMPSAAPCAH